MFHVNRDCNWHGLSYRSILVYRLTVGMVHTSIPTYGTMRHTNKPVYTAYIGLLLDWYMSCVPSSMSRYDKPTNWSEIICKLPTL